MQLLAAQYLRRNMPQGDMIRIKSAFVAPNPRIEDFLADDVGIGKLPVIDISQPSFFDFIDLMPEIKNIFYRHIRKLLPRKSYRFKRVPKAHAI
ncbi:MAG: hypothetical protein LBP73_05015 [Clostridiales Family XIII bacterium]|nr:hypothetical protein [Clostridiales Family XIII bacterium]